MRLRKIVLHGERKHILRKEVLLLGVNYFEAFGIPVKYKIDENLLVQTYLQKQSCFHPDLNDSGSRESAFLNKAYKILSDPIARAEHFLEVHGKRTDILDPEFSLEAFDLREKYEIEEDKENFQEELSKRTSELISTLCNLEDNLDEFQKNYGLLRFIGSFLEKVRLDVYCRD
jgi:DnaJ-domain-containing protein 1